MVILLLILVLLAIAAIESPKYIFSLGLLAAMGILTGFYFIFDVSLVFGLIQICAMAAIVFILKTYLMPIADEPIDAQREIFPGLIAAALIILLAVKIYPILTFLPSLEIFSLFLVGLYAAVIKRNLAKMIIGVVIMELSADFFLSVVGERSGVITLVGVGAVLLMAMLAASLHAKAGTLDITKIRELKG